MFGLSFSEILVIMIVALLVLGPKQLPNAARTLGRTMGELRRTMDEMKREVMLPPLELEEEAEALRQEQRRTLAEDTADNAHEEPANRENGAPDPRSDADTKQS